MGQNSSDSPFKNVPLAVEIEHWNSEHEPACTADNFQLDLNLTPRSKWNKSATQTFVDSFLSAGIFEETDCEAVEQAFISHTRSLKQKYMHLRASQEEQLVKWKHVNRDEWK
jgi:hypothetical protein